MEEELSSSEIKQQVNVLQLCISVYIHTCTCTCTGIIVYVHVLSSLYMYMFMDVCEYNRYVHTLSVLFVNNKIHLN